MKDVAFILYSHSNYDDVWEPFFGQEEKFLPDVFKKYMFVDGNADGDKIPDDYTVIVYDDSKAYSERFFSCLEQIPEDVCIFQHEDMFLYDSPKMDKLEKYINVLKESDLDFVKLLKGGDVKDIQYGEHEDLFESEEWFFAIQPTIWKTDRLKQIFEHFKNTNIWDMERLAQEYCKQNNYKGVYCYNGEQKRGRYHWDSSTYPYVATAICKGKWNASEYPSELEEIFIEYDIDRTQRGCR